ncbi:hypothetical protein HIM_01147 [Hirsutella minnesotensis 3608]|nr:hypothetical protein HIM_01147 [Hirsutella minnesotensis 3608]
MLLSAGRRLFNYWTGSVPNAGACLQNELHDGIRPSYDQANPLDTSPGVHNFELDGPAPRLRLSGSPAEVARAQLPREPSVESTQQGYMSYYKKPSSSLCLSLPVAICVVISRDYIGRVEQQNMSDFSISRPVPAVAAGPPCHHLLFTVGFTLSLIVLALVYLAALPKPLPGIPYNKHAARRLFGDVKDIRKSAYRRQWLWSQPRVHGAPVTQAFLFPFRKPTVIISDYRIAFDICSRRAKEFDRGTRNKECVGLTAPNFHFTMQSSDPRLKQHRELLRDLMTPWFLQEVVSPRIYQRAALLIELWNLKASAADSKPFTANHDLYMASLDMISSAAFGMDESQAAIAKEIRQIKSFPSVVLDDSRKSIDFPQAAQGPEIEALLDIADMVAIAQASPFPTLAQYSALLKPKHARAHWHRRALLQRQTARCLTRLAITGGASAPQSALEELLRREKSTASRANRRPDYYSPAIRDEVLGYLLGGHDTTATFLAWWVKFMTRHQDIQGRLRNALRQVHFEAVDQSRSPSMSEIFGASIPYLDAVLEESLRCASVATLIVRKATRDTHILGYPIPEGTDVLIPLTGPSLTEEALAIPESLRSQGCRNAKDRVPAWGSDVADYKPQRWLKRERNVAGETVEVFDPKAGPSLVFSCGPRQCFGKKQAYLQLRTTMTLLLWNFSFEPIHSSLDNWEIKESLVNLPKKCYVKLKKL